MSELRKAARALVERRTERIESRHALAESQARLAAALGRAAPHASTAFTPKWSTAEGRAVLEASYGPAPRIGRWLKLFSVGMALLVGASAWMIAATEGPGRFLLPLFTAFAILALPYVALGMGSQRAAEEARIAKAIRVALLDEEERLPPPQRWEDED